MKRWDRRPVEIKNLFNAGFCALVLSRALQGFDEGDPKGMPFSLALLVLPLCLHKETREVVAANPRRYLLKTLEQNPQILVGLPGRVHDLLPFTLEGLGLAFHLNCFEVSQDGCLKTVAGKIRKAVNGTAESISCQRVARIVAKEFARIGDRVTIYTSLGVRP